MLIQFSDLFIWGAYTIKYKNICIWLFELVRQWGSIYPQILKAIGTDLDYPAKHNNKPLWPHTWFIENGEIKLVWPVSFMSTSLLLWCWKILCMLLKGKIITAVFSCRTLYSQWLLRYSIQKIFLLSIFYKGFIKWKPWLSGLIFKISKNKTWELV